ncbi:hypothetical protein I203_105237 [Kwoniella mangroviensis CBS 8507]|uniref:uncharacterized protein n=1 Tax=Kwoniella mangroviensis CBS 8507 TaxID=1296122 RepID=UPI00080CF541|nr:uncharacterized protein I203_01056 [Kwoniella mangroviensis CBS 8507]OCF69202.1 hypothetical protein I203_01056 [Kwoniella mangroviensis CBS 8507]
MSSAQEKENPAADGPSQAEWIQIRESWTNQAVEDGDVETLRKISALPGGFGGNDTRKKAWSTLLQTHLIARQTARKVNRDDNSRQGEDSSENGDKLVDRGNKEETTEQEAGPSEPKPHPNERQVRLDTDRSFVTYPKGIPAQSKLELQADLNDLIVGVLRKYPALSYFQGYHDIISVLYLTFIPSKPIPQRSRSSSTNRIRKDRGNQRTPEALSTPAEKDQGSHEVKVEEADEKLSGNVSAPVQSEKDDLRLSEGTHEISPPPSYDAISRDTPEWRELRKCAEMVSLNRVRDAMGSGMEGMMGLLWILKRILKAADPELSKFSSKISPVPKLPFFALSWVLTLFSHDCDRLQPIQRMFDFLLARNPISAVYLAASILILKKPQMFEIAHQLGSEYEEDPTLLHPLFVRLPPLCADTPSEPDPPPTLTPSPKTSYDDFEEDSVNPYRPIKLSELFLLTDTLMEQYPWDGEVIRGTEVMGEGSVVNTYHKERIEEEWSAEEMLGMIDVQVVKPGAGDLSDDEELDEEPVKQKRRRLPIVNPRNKINTLLAFGVVVLGVGIAVYGFKADGNEASWNRWWSMVIRGLIGKEGRGLEGLLGRGIGWVKKAVRDVM